VDKDLTVAIQEWLDKWEGVRDALWDLDVIEEIVQSNQVNQFLLDMQGDVAEHRRQGVRMMRQSGWTLKAIADATGMTHQRVSQLEQGNDRKDKG
jgi:hypothetical protein